MLTSILTAGSSLICEPVVVIINRMEVHLLCSYLYSDKNFILCTGMLFSLFLSSMILYNDMYNLLNNKKKLIVLKCNNFALVNVIRLIRKANISQENSTLTVMKVIMYWLYWARIMDAHMGCTRKQCSPKTINSIHVFTDLVGRVTIIQKEAIHFYF